MYARSPGKRKSDSEFILGPPFKKKFKRILLPNDNSEDEDGAASLPTNGNIFHGVKVPKISIDDTRSVDDRKSEIEGENCAKAVKKSDLSLFDGGSMESKNDSTGFKESSDCSPKDTKKGSVKNQPGKIFGQKLEPMFKSSKPNKEDLVKDSVIPEKNEGKNTNDHKKHMEGEKKRVPVIKSQQNKAENIVPQSASCAKGSKNHELTTRMSGDKSRAANPLIKRITNESCNHQKDEKGPLQNKDATCKGTECDVERVLAQLFDSPTKSYNENRFFNREENMSIASNAKVALNFENKSSKVVSQLGSKIFDSSKACDKRHDVPKDVNKSNNSIQKNTVDSHTSMELKEKHTKPVSGVRHDSSNISTPKNSVRASSDSIKESLLCTKNVEEPKKVCDKPMVSADRRSEKVQRSKSMADNAAGSRSEQVFSNDSQKHTNSGKSPSSVKELLASHSNGTKKLHGKPGNPNCHVNKISEKVSKVVGDSSAEGNGTSHTSVKQVDNLHMKNIKRSLSVGNAPVDSVGELRAIHLVQNPKSGVSQPWPSPSPVKSRLKRVDGDWVISNVYKNTPSAKNSNAIEIGNEFPETKEKLHFFSKETVSVGNLSKVIEKCRQKVSASTQIKEKAFSGSLLDNVNKHTLHQVVRTPLKISKPSMPLICGNSGFGEEPDGTPLVQSNSEPTKAASTPKVVHKCQKFSKDVKIGNLKKSIHEEEQIHGSSLRSNDRCPSPLPGIVAENIDELMREYEELTNRAAAAKASTRKKIERRPSQKKMLNMFGEEHLLEDCQSILQIPLTSKEKGLPEKQFPFKEGVLDCVAHVSPPDKVAELKPSKSSSERSLINKEGLSYSKLKAGKKRNLSESLDRQKTFEKGRRNSSGTSSEAFKISDKELTDIQSILLEKSKPFAQKHHSVASSNEATPPSTDNINDSNSNCQKPKSVAKKLRKSTERRISKEKGGKGEKVVKKAEKSSISYPSLKSNSERPQESKSKSNSVDESSQCLSLENVCKTQRNESISGANEINLRDPKLGENLNIKEKEKENECVNGGNEKENSADNQQIQSVDQKVLPQPPKTGSHDNIFGSPTGKNSLTSSTTIECDKEIVVDAARASLMRELLITKPVDTVNDSLVDEEMKACYAKKLKDINASLSLSLGLLADIPVESLSGVQESLENPIDDREGTSNAPSSEYVKKLEQKHDMLEKLVGEAMAQKYLIWKQLQSYHGIIEIKKEVPDDSLGDECQIVFSSEDVSWIKDDANSSAETEVFDSNMDDSTLTQKNVGDEDQYSDISMPETSESEPLNLETSEHLGRNQDSISNSIAPSADGWRVGSKELNQIDLNQPTMKKETSGYNEDINEKNSMVKVLKSVACANIAEPADSSSLGNAVVANPTGNAGPSSTSQQSEGLEVANISAIPSKNQFLTNTKEQSVSQSNTVIVFCNSNVNRPSPYSSNKPHSAQVLDKPNTTSGLDKEISPPLQSNDKKLAVEHNENNLTANLGNNGRESEDLNFSRREETTVNTTNNKALISNNSVSIGEKRIRVRGIEDLLEKPPNKSSETPVECQSGNDSYLSECFVCEDGVTWFNYLVFYMLKIARKIEAFIEKSSVAPYETSEVEDTFKENCVIIYDLFKKVIVRFKSDPNSFITILFMKMVTQWKNFKGLLTLDSLKTVIKKCFAKCLELMSPAKYQRFLLEANVILAKVRIFPPLVLGNPAEVTNSFGIFDRATNRSNPETTTTSLYPNVQPQSSHVNFNQTTHSHGKNAVRYLEFPSSTTQILQGPPHNNQVQHAPGPSSNKQVQINQNVVNNGSVGQNIIQLPAGHNDILRTAALMSVRPSDRQPSSESSTQRNALLSNMNAATSKHVSHLQHLIALARHVQNRGATNQGSCSVTSGQTLASQNSSADASFLGGSSQSQHKNTPPSYPQSSSNISSRFYQPSMMNRSISHAPSNSAQGSGIHMPNAMPGLYSNTEKGTQQITLPNTTYRTSDIALPAYQSSNNHQKNANNHLSSSGENVTQPQVLSSMRPSMLGSYYGADVSSSSNGSVRSSMPSGSESHSVAQHFSSNHLNAASVPLAQGNSIPPAPSLSVRRTHPNSLGSSQPLSIPSAINPIMRQPIQAPHQSQVQVSENNNVTGMNGYQISCHVTVNPHISYPVNSNTSVSSGGPSELVRTAGHKSTDISSAIAPQRLNINRSIFQNHEQNRQIPHGNSLSTNTLAAQSQPGHQLVSSLIHSASRLNLPSDSNSGNILSSAGSDSIRYSLENLSFQQNRTDVAIAGNSLGQSQISANNLSTVHTYQQHNLHEASTNNALLSQLHHSNLHPNSGPDQPSYPYSLSLMKQAEARSSLQQPLPGPVHSTSPGIFPEDIDQARGRGTNRSVSRDSGYRSPSQVNEVDPCYVCGKEARNTCSACKSVFYCHHDCQMGDWERHRWECRSTN